MLMRKISKKKIKKFYKNSQISINLDKIEIYDFGKPGMSFSNIILTNILSNKTRPHRYLHTGTVQYEKTAALPVS